MKNRTERLETVKGGRCSPIRSPLDLWRLKGGDSHRPQEGLGPTPDSILAVLGDRATYTFILDDEVASIHFDKGRGEIFFRGHNIKHLDLTKNQVEALMHMEEVLKADRRAQTLFSGYSATLARCLADK